jgi:hypothetical protein
VESRSVNAIHMVLGLVVIAANGVAGAWGGIAWLRRSPSVVFWYLLRVAQAAVVLQVGVGLALVLGGRRPPDALHLVYGIAPLVVALVTEAMRVGAAQREIEEVGDLEAAPRAEQVAVARRVVRRETGIMAVGTLVIVTLALRAAFTGG